MAKAGSSNAAGWLSSRFGESEEAMARAGHEGSEGVACSQVFPCQYQKTKNVFQHLLMMGLGPLITGLSSMLGF